jgi:hypothetical protein
VGACGCPATKIVYPSGQEPMGDQFPHSQGPSCCKYRMHLPNSSRLHHLFPAVSKPYQLAAEQALRQHLPSGVSSFIPSLPIAATVARLSIHSILPSHPVQQPFVLTLNLPGTSRITTPKPVSTRALTYGICHSVSHRGRLARSSELDICHPSHAHGSLAYLEHASLHTHCMIT